jgi:hypothetical protein
MGYHILKSDGSKLVGNTVKEEGPAIFELACGAPYEATEDELPFRFSYKYPDGAALPEFQSSHCLMSLRLVEALKGAGIDNLQVFPAVLKDAKTGAERKDFAVVNVVGLVAAADMKSSESLALGGGQVFTKLVVDDTKPHALLMFRLAESLIDVVVHDSIADVLRAGEFHGLLLKPAAA